MKKWDGCSRKSHIWLLKLTAVLSSAMTWPCACFIWQTVVIFSEIVCYLRQIYYSSRSERNITQLVFTLMENKKELFNEVCLNSPVFI